MTTNKSQYTLTTQWIVPEDKKSEVESFFAEHEVWMRETHNLSGNDELIIARKIMSFSHPYFMLSKKTFNF